jgi:hypothetical protein
MSLAVDALVYDTVAYNGVLVNWHRLINEFSKIVEIW